MVNKVYALYFLIFVSGILLGRITMAIQYALMKTESKVKKNEPKETNSYNKLITKYP